MSEALVLSRRPDGMDVQMVERWAFPSLRSGMAWRFDPNEHRITWRELPGQDYSRGAWRVEQLGHAGYALVTLEMWIGNIWFVPDAAIRDALTQEIAQIVPVFRRAVERDRLDK